MLEIKKTSKIYVYGEPINMSKSFKGLAQIVEELDKKKTKHNDLFVFFNRKYNYVKVLYYEKFSMCIWAKRLDPGFVFDEGVSGNITVGQLEKLLKSYLLPTLKQELKKAA